MPRPNLSPSPEQFTLPSIDRSPLSNALDILGRKFARLSSAAGAFALTATTVLLPPSAEATTTFSNDYPNSGAMPYNVAAYEWWVDENGDGQAQVTPSDTDDDETLSSRGYFYRNCTDGVAYWVAKYTGVSVHGWGNAANWDNAAANVNYMVKNGDSNAIEPGDIAQSDDGDFGHVGFVTDVVKDANNTVTSIKVAELNKGGDGNYTLTTYSAKDASNYFKRYASGTQNWDHFIDVNGANKGLNGEDIANPTPPAKPATSSKQ